MIKSLVKSVNSKGFFHLLTANYFIGFLGLASQLIVVKFLSPIEMGQIKTLQSFIVVISIVAGFGFNTAVLKICSEHMDLVKKREIFTKNLLLTIVSIAFVLALVYLLTTMKILSKDEAINEWLVVYLLVVPAAVLTGLFMTYLQALKQIKLMATVQSAIRLLGVVAIVVFTYYYGFSGFVWASVIVAYIGFVGIWFLIKKEIRINISYSLQKRNYSYALWSFMGNLVSTGAMYLDIFVLNSISKDKELFGFYSITTIFLLGLNYITSTVQSVATPYFSQKSNNEKEFKRVLYKYLKILILVSIFAGVVSYFVVPFIVNIFYGNEYKSVGEFFQILVFKYIFWSGSALVGVAVLAIGKMKFNFFVVILTTIIAFFITYFLGLEYGAYGVAYGQALSYFIAMVLIILVGLMTIKKHFK
jgi:O-antigen/teichoic acid export membrane protein